MMGGLIGKNLMIEGYFAKMMYLSLYKYMHEPMKLDYLWAALCLVGAVYFIFRSA